MARSWPSPPRHLGPRAPPLTPVAYGQLIPHVPCICGNRPPHRLSCLRGVSDGVRAGPGLGPGVCIPREPPLRGEEPSPGAAGLSACPRPAPPCLCPQLLPGDPSALPCPGLFLKWDIKKCSVRSFPPPWPRGNAAVLRAAWLRGAGSQESPAITQDTGAARQELRSTPGRGRNPRSSGG